MARRSTSLRRLVLAAVVALALVPAAAGAVGTLDQQQGDGTSAAFSITSTASEAQTFTAGVTGQLDRVELLLSQNTTASTSTTVQIRNVNADGTPGTTILATSSVAADAPPQYPAQSFVAADFATPAPVVAGTEYAIVASSSNTAASLGYHRWGFEQGDPYPTGASFIMFGPPSGTWEVASVGDFGFRTYVSPPSAPCNGLSATITGTPGNDTLTGTDGVDVIAGLGGNDTIKGLVGNDVICGGDGTDVIDGGSGNDKVLGDAGNDTLNGGSGDDTLDGGSGADQVKGGSGNDKVLGDAGNDTLNGGSGDDTLDGGSGADQVKGGSDKDNLTGGSGSPDKCDGGSGTDTGGSGCETKVSLP